MSPSGTFYKVHKLFFLDDPQPYEERDKVVLIEKGKNHFEMLPEGWIQATHNSGMPLYLHKQTRVCTLSKPYFLGPGSVRVSCIGFLISYSFSLSS